MAKRTIKKTLTKKVATKRTTKKDAEKTVKTKKTSKVVKKAVKAGKKVKTAKKVKSKTTERTSKATSTAKREKKPLPKAIAAHGKNQKHTKPVAKTVTKATAPKAPVKANRRLTSKDVGMFRQMLLDKRAQLVGDVGTLHDEALRKSRRDATGDLSSMPIHMADLGTDNYELEFTLGLIEGERAVLNEIDEALERIHQGTYGICLATGKQIGKARLRAKPWAKYCYEYMLEQEKGKQHRL
ncbi:MAG: TraR/DksA C4-type zinc finger protein [Planctomycetota bacterium]